MRVSTCSFMTERRQQPHSKFEPVGAELADVDSRLGHLGEVVTVLLTIRVLISPQQLALRAVETHHAQKAAPKRVPQVGAALVVGVPLRVLGHLVRSGRTRVPRHLPLNRGEEVFRGLVVAANVEAAHAEVVRRARERRAQVERLAVRADCVLRHPPVRERRTESVPEEEVLRLVWAR